jgi:hypothetical protein
MTTRLRGSKHNREVSPATSTVSPAPLIFDGEGHGYFPAENQNADRKNGTPPVFGSMRTEKKGRLC